MLVTKEILALLQNFVLENKIQSLNGCPVRITNTSILIGPELFGMDFTVPAKPFLSVLKRCVDVEINLMSMYPENWTDEEIDAAMDSGENGIGLMITSEDGKTSSGIMFDDSSFPLTQKNITKNLKAWDKASYKELSGDMISALCIASGTAAKKWTMGTLACVCLGNKTICASDDTKAYQSPEFDFGLKENFLIDAKEVPKDFSRFTEYAFTKDFFLLRGSEYVLGLAKVIGEYPDVSVIFKKIPKDAIHLDTDLPFEDLLNVTKTSEAFSEEVQITISNAMIIRGESEIGFYSEMIPIETPFKDPVSFMCTIPILKELLVKITDESKLVIFDRAIRAYINDHVFAASLSECD